MNTSLPHRRLNPLTGEWVLVSPHRTRRPWQGKVEQLPEEDVPEYDPGCYLCPGNARAGGIRNPEYDGTFVFDNDFPALVLDKSPPGPPGAPKLGGSGPPDPPMLGGTNDGGPAWLSAEGVAGVCRVICYSPRHDLSIAQLDSDRVADVVETWISQVAELSAIPGIEYIQVFENKGELMGCSNPHPHGQIWATSVVPYEVVKEHRSQTAYLEDHGACLLCGVIAHELDRDERVVCRNDEWVALVPFWAVWPFELLVLPTRHVPSLTALDAPQKRALAEIWQRVVRCYDHVFQVTMPFSWGWHVAPVRPTDPGLARLAWHTHAHFYPPLLRSATVRKFMVGYEMLAGPQRDITAEQAAARLRELV